VVIAIEELFRDSLDEEIGIGDRRHVGNRNEVAEHCSLLCFRQLALLDFAIEILGDSVHSAIEVALLDVAQDHLVAGARENMRDAVAHGACAQHGDGFDVVNAHEISPRFSCCCRAYRGLCTDRKSARHPSRSRASGRRPLRRHAKGYFLHRKKREGYFGGAPSVTSRTISRARDSLAAET
jgi:hypothetical protein